MKIFKNEYLINDNTFEYVILHTKAVFMLYQSLPKIQIKNKNVLGT